MRRGMYGQTNEANNQIQNGLMCMNCICLPLVRDENSLVGTKYLTKSQMKNGLESNCNVLTLGGEVLRHTAMFESQAMMY